MIRRLPADAAIVDAATMRACEAGVFAAGTSQTALMERAGHAVAVQVVRLAAGRPILVLAGPGDNGGDAYVAARHLRAAGRDVVVATLGQPKVGAAATMAAGWAGPTVPLAEAQPRAVLVDGLLGIGRVRSFADHVAAKLGRLSAAADLRITIDVPSGMDADTGCGGLSADVTIALGALKPAHVLGDGGARCGDVILADIGVPLPTTWRSIARPTLPAWPHDVNKFTRGMVVVVGGAMAGAGRLAAGAAMSAGAGYVMLTTRTPHDGPPHALVQRQAGSADDLATLLDDDRIGAVVVGPGLGRDAAAQDMLAAALDSPRDLVIDGDALTLLGRDGVRRLATDRRQVVLTPHAGEFARMFDTAGGKVAATLAAVRESGAIIVHKGPDTVIGYPDGRAIVSAAANPGLSTAGSGDVLAGTIAARVAAAREQGGGDAVAAGVWLHARAADRLGPIFIADQLIAELPEAVTACPTT